MHVTLICETCSLESYCSVWCCRYRLGLMPHAKLFAYDSVIQSDGRPVGLGYTRIHFRHSWKSKAFRPVGIHQRWHSVWSSITHITVSCKWSVCWTAFLGHQHVTSKNTGNGRQHISWQPQLKLDNFCWSEVFLFLLMAASAFWFRRKC